MGNILENKIDMKFAALLAVVVAQEANEAAPVTEDKPAEEPIVGKSGLGGACNPTAEDQGCEDPYRCAIKPVPNICVTKEACDLEVAGVKAECGATALAASLVAALAVASTF